MGIAKQLASTFVITGSALDAETMDVTDTFWQDLEQPVRSTD